MDSALRQLERAWQAAPDDEGALDRLLAELRRGDLDPVERLAALSDAPWAHVMRASLPILRRDEPDGRAVSGRRLRVIVHNGAYFHTNADVFADGLIDCWGAVDRALFARKLSDDCGDVGPPIVTEVPGGADVSTHGLGSVHVFGAPSWIAARADVLRAAMLVVRALAEPGRPLVDMQGSATELRGGVRHAKRGLLRARPYRRGQDGAAIEGEELPLFVLEDGPATLARWVLYADGSSRVVGDPWDPSPLQPFEAVAARVGRDLTTEVPAHTVLSLPGVGCFQLGPGPRFHVEPGERVREARDLLAQLRGEPGAGARCRAAFTAYEREEARPETDPGRAAALAAARDVLRQAYEAVPEHTRLYLGDMDSKDWPIRRALYGPQEDDVEHEEP